MLGSINVTPPFDIKSVSPVQSLSAGDQLTITHKVMTIEGNGGPVTSTATPFIDPQFEINGFVVWIFGNDSTNTITLQDYRNLAGTKIALEASLDATLGEDQFIAFMFRSLSGRWTELTRSQN